MPTGLSRYRWCLSAPLFAQLALLGSFPLALTTSTGFATKDLVRCLGLEQLAASPVLTLPKFLGVQVVPVIGKFAIEGFDTHRTSLVHDTIVMGHARWSRAAVNSRVKA